eukprot:12855079-Ditylum_brightwellii.AAC.1
MQKKNGEVAGFAGNINPLTTIPLPTDQEWVEAVENDPDLRLIRTSLEQPGGGSLSKAQLEDKGYFPLWERKNL